MKRYYTLSALALIIFASCQKTDFEVDPSTEPTVREIVATGSIGTSTDSKAYVDDQWGIYWSATQQLGGWITSSEVSTTEFTKFSSANSGGETSIQFTGEITTNSDDIGGVESGENIRFLHPYIYSPEPIVDNTIGVSLTTQTVDMSTPKSHLTNYMFMMSDVLSIDSNGSVEEFKMKHIGSFLNLDIAFDDLLDEGAKAKIFNIELTGLPVEAELNLSTTSTIDDCISNISSSETLSAPIYNASTISNGETLVVPLAVFPGNVSALKVVVSYYIGANKYILTKEITPTDLTFKRANYHNLTITCNKSSCDINEGYSISGSGTEDLPYKINNSADLVEFSNLINFGALKSEDDATQYYFEVTDNIDLEGTADNQWIAIGNEANQFTYHFDGNNKTISGIYIDNELEQQGLFGIISTGGVVKNLTVEGKISSSGGSIGGIAGYNNLGTITDCNSNCEIYSQSISSGGIVGDNLGTITNCNNSGDICGASTVGGIVGCNYNGVVSNCNNSGTVSSKSDSESDYYIGGIVGYNRYDYINTNYGTINNCRNEGTVSASNIKYIGGIAGYNSTIITNSVNLGPVKGKQYVGGIAGSNTTRASISCSFNNGSVESAADYSGGIVGINKSTVDNCYNTAKVTGGTTYVGGVAGYNFFGDITNSYNIGSISGSSSVGGLVGEDYGDITNCYRLENCVTQGEDCYEGTEKSSGEMQASGFVTTLNVEQSPAPWEADSEPYINNGYPILSWQAE